jgi:hypothetical protein
MLGALSDERSGLYFPVFAGHRQRSLSQIWVTRNSWAYFIVSIFETPPTWRVSSCVYFPQEQRSQFVGNCSGARRIRAQLLTLAGLLQMPCRPRGELCEVSLAIVGPRGTWWLPTASGGSRFSTSHNGNRPPRPITVITLDFPMFIY